MQYSITIKNESLSDYHAIDALIQSAFANHPYSNNTEYLIVQKLRADNALALGLVAEVENNIVGYIAFSEVLINGQKANWYGLGPIAVLPKFQRQGIGTLLIRQGIDKIKKQGAHGIVLVGDPTYYNQFGFLRHPELIYNAAPEEYFLSIPFIPEYKKGVVEYHPSFSN